MQKNGLLLLTGLTIASIAAAGWAVHRRSSAASSAVAAGPLFVGLAEHVNDVREIDVSDGKTTVTLKNDGKQWGLVERGNYPAKFEKVKQTIVGLSRLEIEEPKTRKKEQYPALGVQDPAAEGTTSKRVVLKDGKGATLAAAVLSEPKYRGNSQTLHARREGDDQVYLSAGSLELDPAPKNWIETELLKLQADRVQKVQIVQKDGEELTIGRSAENHTQFVPENVPADREATPGAANGIGTALSYLSLEDVRPAAEVDFQAEPRAQTHFVCHDGLVVDIETARFEGKNWIKLQARYEEPAEVGPTAPPTEAPPAAAGTEPGEGGAEGEAAAKDAAPKDAVAGGDAQEGDAAKPDPEKIKKEAEELSAKFAGWAYQVPDYRADVLARRMEDLLKKPGEPGAGDAPPPEELPSDLQKLLDQAGATPPADPGGGDDADDGSGGG